MLEQYVKDRLAQRGMLLMTHIVLGHPDFDTSLRLVETMAHAGVDLMELQIPFSEPIADGPVILHANQEALNGGATVERCFELAFHVARRFDLPLTRLNTADDIGDVLPPLLREPVWAA